MFLIHVLVGGVMILDKSLQKKKKKKKKKKWCPRTYKMIQQCPTTCFQGKVKTKKKEKFSSSSEQCLKLPALIKIQKI